MEHTSTRWLIGDASRRLRSLREGKIFWGAACAFLFGISLAKKDSLTGVLAVACSWFCYCLSERADSLEASIERLKRAEEEGHEEELETVSRRLEHAINASFISMVRGVF